MLVVGIDSHKDSLVGCVVDEGGRDLSYGRFENTGEGHGEVLDWVQKLDAGRVAIEGSGGYGRPLALVLLAAGVEVVDVPPQMTARARRTQRSRHHPDPTDALLIARVGAREPDLPRPRPHGAVEDLRVVVFYRREQVVLRNREANRLHADLTQLHSGYQHRISGRLTRPAALDQVTQLISPDPSVRAEVARRRVATLRSLIIQIKELDQQVADLVAVTGAEALTGIEGIATTGAGEILAEVGHPHKYPTKAKFAMANGTAPLQASSGRIIRHRLNRTIHIAALTQIRRPGTEGRLYYERLQTRGKTNQEAIRVLELPRFRGQFAILLSTGGLGAPFVVYG